jgi:hypothetical protein
MSTLFLNAVELELLRCFNSFKVRYLVIGGHAVQFHGYLRSAKDLDIFIDTSGDNPSRVVTALRSLGFSGGDLSANQFSEPKKQIPLGGYSTELLTSPDGPPFEEAYARRVVANEIGFSVPVVSRDDLLQQKRKLGRPQDIADIEALQNGETAV